MERHDRDRYDNGGNRPQNRFDHYHDNWSGRGMSRDDQHYPYDSRNEHPRAGQFQNRDDDFRRNDSHQYRKDQDGQHPYQSNYRQDRDQFGDAYQRNFRHDPTMPRGSEDEDLMGNIRQGYGISSYDGTSDRFNTLNSEHRYGDRQDEQPYYSGAQDEFRSAQFGSGLGDSGLHSDRGIPNYSTRSFQDPYGSGLGSSYGGTNYGGGTGYTGGHMGGTWGNNSYGSYSGNIGGYGSMNDSSYGSGMGSSGNTSSQNNGRSTRELGGF
ncbi:hypothetical protein [Rufibacter hautae]|uniref:Uncharacterized protein n=1 Tax=Rufibacter hautae TaxID=2595005 RepID=A0A5B6TAX4_9BACT|nr:hypothetical protein [Rufibacter hautae]KAA3437609.1 hypothetical protein FOA19_09860 [Rufibacter hautae]